MKEALEEAKEELKRVDHLIYVSLKYTRTVDVLMNVINRMIDCYSGMIDSLLKWAVEEKKIMELPSSPVERGELVKKLFPEQEFGDNVELYFLLRKIHRSNPQKENEYRRHVTLRTFIEGREEIVNIDIATQYYFFQKKFFEAVEKVVLGKT
ncbi:MAG TPA: hypothetical protein VJG90_02785 [Candidatus Nanoarchaeia archaeon]|nr:hypothetical protein [Candidatus Nanoarchaeia archaeon]